MDGRGDWQRVYGVRCDKRSASWWHWKIGEHEWRWPEGGIASSQVRLPSGEWGDVVLFFRLEHAVAFALGFQAGFLSALGVK